MFLPVAGHRVPALADLKRDARQLVPDLAGVPVALPAPRCPGAATGWRCHSPLRSRWPSAASAAKAGGGLRPQLARLGALNLVAMLHGGVDRLLGDAGPGRRHPTPGVVAHGDLHRLLLPGRQPRLAIQDVGPAPPVRLLERRGASRQAGPPGRRRRSSACPGPGGAGRGAAVLAPRVRLLREGASPATGASSPRSSDRLPPGSAVFQLPLASFPERPAIVNMLDYSLGSGLPPLQAPALELPGDAGPSCGLDVGPRGPPARRRAQRRDGRRLHAGCTPTGPASSTRASASNGRWQADRARPRSFSPDGYLLFWDLRPWADRQLATLGPERHRGPGRAGPPSRCGG